MSAGPEHAGAAPSKSLDDAESRALDAAAILAVRRGDKDAYDPLVRRHLPRLHGLLRRFFRQRADVDDLAQAAFLRAYEQLERYDETLPFYPWLRRIAVNLALNELQRRKRRAELPESELVLSQQHSAPTSDRKLRAEELVIATQRELEQLPPQWAAVFRLRVFEEMSYGEIAQALEIPIGTVMSSLARARLRLAQALAADFGGGGEES